MVKPKQLMNRVSSIEELTDEIYKMMVESEYIAENAVAGQFVNIKCCDGTQALLRRPISICSVNRSNGSYDILFQKKGSGTGLLALKKPGDRLDILGPLGNGFDLDIKYRRVAVVGGGIGIFPLLFILNESKSVVKRAYLGFRTKKLVVLEDEFKSSSSTLEITTDDGSYGENGFVTDLLKRDILFEKFDMIYACGPTPMLKKVIETANANGINCQVSLEQRMGCGFGACLVCACKTQSENGDWQYSHVCKDGPIFDSRTVILE
jgi:dihydroorotate dehydrogenase electron transfer subunit